MENFEKIQQKNSLICEKTINKTMLSDEEKEIFNNLKEYMQSEINKGYHKFIYNDLDWDFKCIDCINAIDKVLKQSKEIEELKDKCKELIFEKQELTSALLDSTPQDKIKAKIGKRMQKNNNTIHNAKLKHGKDYVYYDDVQEAKEENRICKEILQSLLDKE